MFTLALIALAGAVAAVPTTINGKMCSDCRVDPVCAEGLSCSEEGYCVVDNWNPRFGNLPQCPPHK
ncbi:hypothetical protein HK101_004991, partial [Irineochytrium annulatum]